MKKQNAHRGFTLVEMIVSVALFAIVTLISVSTVLALVNANRKAQALQSVINNLNIALDGLVRSARTGTNFHCGGAPYNVPVDCSSGDTFAFIPFSATLPSVYTFENGTIKRSKGGGPFIPIIASDVVIDSVTFRVVGSTPAGEDPPDNVQQPKAIVVVKGNAGAPGSSARTTFHIQATAVQRALDI